jgi:hypothetical protein
MRPQTVDKVGFCHREPVTDVTGVAIRILKVPFFSIFRRERIATPV